MKLIQRTVKVPKNNTVTEEDCAKIPRTYYDYELNMSILE